MTFVTENMALLTGRPEHVEALKQHILSLAVRGLLVPQEAGDEPAGEVLKRIRAEKAKMKKAEALPPVGEDERPYELPEGWVWCRLGEVGETQTGTTPAKSNPEFFGDFIPFIGPGDFSNGLISYENNGLSLKGLEKGRLIRKGSILMVCIGGSIGKAIIVDRDVSCNQQINTISPIHVNNQYLFFAMTSPVFQERLQEKSTGSATPIINKSKWETLPIPLPPLPKQHRIVAKVASLFALIDRLSAAVREGEETHRRWLGALLRDLGEARSGEEVRLRWGQLSAHFDELIDSVEAVKLLRQVILQLAVRGVLVEQDEGEEPASELLRRIKLEKAKMGKKGEVWAPVGEEERPFEVPEGWEWCRLGEVAINRDAECLVLKKVYTLRGSTEIGLHSQSSSLNRFTVSNMEAKDPGEVER